MIKILISDTYALLLSIWIKTKGNIKWWSFKLLAKILKCWRSYWCHDIMLAVLNQCLLISFRHMIIVLWNNWNLIKISLSKILWCFGLLLNLLSFSQNTIMRLQKLIELAFYFIKVLNSKYFIFSLWNILWNLVSFKKRTNQIHLIFSMIWIQRFLFFD